MYKRIVFFTLSFLLFLNGCQSPVYDQALRNTGDTRYKINVAKNNMYEKKLKTPDSLVVDTGYYVDKHPIDLKKQPSWLSNKIVLRGERLPFSYYSAAVAGGATHRLMTRYQDGLDAKIAFSMNYTGTVKGALDLLASKTGYVYTVNGNDIYWQSIITQTFDIAFMPGDADYQMGKGPGASSSSSSSSSSGSSGSSSSSTTVSAVLDDTASSQYSSLKGALSIWKDLNASITQMLSPIGKVVVSQSTTSVTVSDHPANIKLISKFIDNLNSNLSKQVLVKVEVLTVNLENNFNFGINWNVVQRALGNGVYQLVADNGSPLTLTSLVNLSLNKTTAGINNFNVTDANTAGTGNQATGVIALANALQAQGKVSIVTQPQVLCQNNQVSSIRILDQQGYLASVQQVNTGTTTSGSSAVTSQITPGNIQTGLTLYVLPKILKDKVYLQIYADLSTNLGTKKVSSSANTTTSGSTEIEVPHVTQQQFNERSFVKSGDTLILSGYKQLSNRVGASQLFDSQALGGKTAQQQNVETIVLITPIILHGIG